MEVEGEVTIKYNNHKYNYDVNDSIFLSSSEWSMDCVRLVQEFQDRLVVGIDLAANEAVTMDPRHIAAYRVMVESQSSFRY